MAKKWQSAGYMEWLAFFAVSVLGFGSSFYWIKLAVRELSALELVAYRSTISATFLWLIVYLLRIPLPKSWQLVAKVLLAGVVGGALPNSLISWAEAYVDSSVAGILISLSPILTALFSLLLIGPKELSISKVFGMFLGFGGVYIMLAPEYSTMASHMLPELAIILAAVCYSLFGVFAKLHFSKEHPIALAAISATASATVMISAALLQQGSLSLPNDINTWIAVLWIGIITSALSQILVYHLVRTWGPARLSLITYIMPVVAVILGVGFLGEQLTWPSLYGGGLIMLSIYCASRKSPFRRSFEQKTEATNDLQ